MCIRDSVSTDPCLFTLFRCVEGHSVEGRIPLGNVAALTTAFGVTTKAFNTAKAKVAHTDTEVSVHQAFVACAMASQGVLHNPRARASLFYGVIGLIRAY